MSSAFGTTISTDETRLNVTDRLAANAASMPDAIAVACPRAFSPKYPSIRRGVSGSLYATTTFAELDADATRIAYGLLAWGVPTGSRLALLVRPGIEFITLVFALLRAGMVVVLIDPGLGRRNVIRCLTETKPEGFVAIPLAQAIRLCLRNKFPRACWNVTVGRRWFWGGKTIEQLREMGLAGGGRVAAGTVLAPEKAKDRAWPVTLSDDPAAIIFTSGSTGPAKGVLYTHRMFDIQAAEIQSMYGIEPGGVDLACFPLFALFNSAMGVTTVLPKMDYARPAGADPQQLLRAANDWQATQAFASPAVWRNLSDYCNKTSERIDSLKQVFSCGAPVPASLLRSTLNCIGERAKMHTPYGATECLPVATIEAAEVLAETAERTDRGDGICVGRKFDSIDWRVIRITDDPIATMDDAEELPRGEIGELIVRGPQASPRYVTRPGANSEAKISDGGSFWHRMGDVGYLDEKNRFWYCGRKSQRVETSAGPMYTEIYEAVFNKQPAVRRSALVGVGPRGDQKPVMILETTWPLSADQQNELQHILWDESPNAPQGSLLIVDWPLPVDVRHNSKINREMLARWAADELAGRD